MLPTWRLPDGGTSGGMGILLTMFAIVASVRADVIISDAVYGATQKYLSLSNSGEDTTALFIKAYSSTIEPVISNLTIVARKSVNVTSLAAIALPSSGTSNDVDLSSFKAPEPNNTCGPYFLVFTLTAVGDKDPYQQYPVAVNPTQQCTEDVDLKWVVKDDPKVDFSITVEDGKLKAEGFTMKISNGGNSDLKRRSPLNTPEVLAFIMQAPYDYNETLRGDMHVGQPELLSYWYTDGSSTAVLLDGWSAVLLDVPNKQSISLAKNASVNVSVTGLEIPMDVPDQYYLAVFIIDPYNKTNDSNRTNNFAVAEIQVPYIDPAESRGSCLVVPDGESDGRDATLISWRNGWINAYAYKAKGRGSGFVPVPTSLLGKPLTNYNKVKDYSGKLDAMDLCSDDEDGDEDVIYNSMLMKTVEVIRNLRDSLDNVTLTQPGPAAENNKTKVLLELADALLTRAIEEEGLVRYFLMKGLSAALKKHLFQILMPGYGMNPMMFEMFLTEAGIPMPRRPPPPPPGYGGGYGSRPGGFPPGAIPPGAYASVGGSFGGGFGGGSVWTGFNGFGSDDGGGGEESGEGNDNDNDDDDDDKDENTGGQPQEEVKAAGSGIFSGLFSGTQNSNAGPALSSQSSTNKKQEQAKCETVYCNFGGTDMCLDESWICDQVVDCSNGKDEENCPSASAMKSDRTFSLINDTMKDGKKEQKHAEVFHSKVAAMLKKSSPQYQGSFQSINFPGEASYPEGGGQEFNNEWGGNGGWNGGNGGGPDEGFFSEFDDDNNGGAMFGGKYSWDNGGGWGGGGGGGGSYGGGERLSPVKMMMLKIFARLASGATAEDLDELSFLDLSTRKLIKKVFTMAVNGDWPKVLLPLQTWTSPSGDFVGEVVEYLKEQQSVPFAITAETIVSAMDFLKTNVSVRVEDSLKGNQTLLDLLKLSKSYMDIIKLNAEDIADLMQMKMELVMSKPQEIGLLLKTPGPEPTTEMDCMKKAQIALALINPQDDEKEDKFFKNPFEQFMALTKEDPKPFYWVIEDGGVFRGERSDVTGTMFYDKVAVCTCDTNSWGSDDNSWSSSNSGGNDGFSNPGSDYNPGSDWGSPGFGGSGDPSKWGMGSGGSFGQGSDWGSPGLGGSGDPSKWGMGSGGSFGQGSDWGSPGFGGSGDPSKWGMGSGGSFGQGFGSGGGFGAGSGSEGGFQSGMWGSSGMRKGESGQRKLQGSTSRRDEEQWDDDKGNHTHSENHTRSENHTHSEGHRMKPRAQNLNPGQADYHFSSNVRKKRSVEHNKVPWFNTNIQLKSNIIKTSEGLVSVEGQVVVTVNEKLELSSICDDEEWGIDDAKVVCNSLLQQHMKEGHDLLSATPTSVPADPAGPEVRISGLKCQGNESNILGCRFLWDQKCKVKEIAGVKCVIK